MIRFLLTLTLASFLCIYFSQHIKKRHLFYYVLALLVPLTQYVILFLGIESPYIKTLMGAINATELGTVLFIIVMYTGALDTQHATTRSLYRIRKELSIIACYLISFHCIGYLYIGLSHSFNPNGFALIVNISGIIAFIIGIPLLITSYTKVRKKLKGGRWKKIQRYAYVFYFLTYIHIVYANIRSNRMAIDKISLYTVIFGAYLILRLIKAFGKKNPKQNIMKTKKHAH